MSREAKLWFGGTALAAALVTLALVPPHDVFRLWRVTGSSHPTVRAARLAERHLSEARAALEALETADSILRRAGSLEPGSITTIAQAGLHPDVQSHVDRLLEPVRAQPRGSHALPVALALTYRSGERGASHWSSVRSVRYLTPHVTGSPACLTIVDATQYQRIIQQGGRAPVTEALDAWLGRRPRSHLMGPCAWFAAFGLPGDSIRMWLDRWGWYTARSPQWMFEREARPLDARLSPDVRAQGRLRQVQARALPDTPDLYACAAGHEDACVVAANAGVDGRTKRTITSGLKHEVLVLVSSRAWWRRSPLGEGTEVFLSDMVGDLGAERFQRFWQSNLPIEDAFAQAFDVGLGEWTMRWARSYLGVPPAGPSVRFASVVVAFAMVGIVVGGTAAWVRFRQVA